VHEDGDECASRLLVHANHQDAIGRQKGEERHEQEDRNRHGAEGAGAAPPNSEEVPRAPEHADDEPGGCTDETTAQRRDGETGPSELLEESRSHPDRAGEEHERRDILGLNGTSRVDGTLAEDRRNEIARELRQRERRESEHQRGGEQRYSVPHGPHPPSEQSFSIVAQSRRSADHGRHRDPSDRRTGEHGEIDRGEKPVRFLRRGRNRPASNDEQDAAPGDAERKREVARRRVPASK